jgi:hypothetical protein
MRSKGRVWWLLIALCLGCTDSRHAASDPSYLLGTGAGGVPGSQLFFLQLTSPSVLGTQSGSFWAVKGQQRTLELNFSTGEPLMKFTVGPNSLLQLPGGAFLLPGDSVLITVQITTTNGIVFDFQPSGLRFHPLSPAALEISTANTNPDIDGDGDVDLRDVLLASGLLIWRQEFPGLPWIPQPTVRLDPTTLVTGVFSFTGFAAASN